MLQITGVATHLNAGFIASLVGKIISMGLALGPMSRIMTRNLYVLLWSRHAWCEHLEINRGVCYVIWDCGDYHSFVQR